MILSLLARTQISWGNVKKKRKKNTLLETATVERTTKGRRAGRQAGRQATTTLPGVAKRPQLFFFFFSNSYLPCHDAYIHRLLISVRYLPSAIFKGTRTDARREIYEWRLVLSPARRSYPRFRLKPPLPPPPPPP